MDEVKSAEEEIAQCVDKFKQTDFIMEPSVVDYLGRYYEQGGPPEKAIQLLSSNYTAVAQMVNLLADWLVQLQVDANVVRETIEAHFCHLIKKHFDPNKADSIFTLEGRAPDWLGGLIKHEKWRTLLYELADEYPDCLMLNFTVKLIAEAGFQGEITGVATACQQIEVYCGVLTNAVKAIVANGETSLKEHIGDLSSKVVYAEHSFLFALILLKVLSEQQYGGSLATRIMQEILQSDAASDQALNVVTMKLAVERYGQYPRVTQALASMLSKRQLNPADITVLYKAYSSDSPPPVAIIREAQFLQLLQQAVFSKTASVNPDHKHKYSYLLAYAVTVYEGWKNNRREFTNNDDLKATLAAIEKASAILVSKGANELLPEVETLFNCMRYPIVGSGLLLWIECEVQDESIFHRNVQHTPVVLALLDEIVVCHVLLRDKVFSLLCELFTRSFSSLQAFVRIELKKNVIDRMIHLVSLGYVTPVLKFMTSCMSGGGDEKQPMADRVDVSLIRYFVTEILDIVGPPYTAEFLSLMKPFLENEAITEVFKSGSADAEAVADMLQACHEELT